MRLHVDPPRPRAAAIAFDLLNPLPFGFFVAALIFDVVYANNADVLWLKSAAWLITFGLLLAILPRFINLARVWILGKRDIPSTEKWAFWLYLLGIVAAIVNAFVHSRDAYAAIPEGVWLSALTVLLIAAAKVVLSVQQLNAGTEPCPH